MGGKPLIIGVLGGFAAGKSRVASCLKALGAVVVDADRIAHEVLGEEDLRAAVVEIAGDEAFRPDGRPDRGRIGRAVFADAERLARLEALVHPRVLARVKEAIRAAGDARAVVVDAPLLLEGGLGGVTDVLIFVEAPIEARRARAAADRAWPAEEAGRREALQMAVEEKRRRADHVVTNDGTLKELDERVGRLFLTILDERE